MEATRDHHGVRPGLWSDAPTRASLQVLAEGAATLAGFAEAAISVRRDDVLEVVATSGPRTSELIGRRTPVDLLETELVRADVWGDLRFVPHERVSGEVVLAYNHVPDLEPGEGPDGWHPLDFLMAPLYDDVGELRGLLSVDAPSDGRRPGPVQRALLGTYARIARTSVLLAMEREDLAERVRMATEAREMVRRALGAPSLDEVIEACRPTLISSFDALGMWLSVFDAQGEVTSTWYAHGVVDRPMLGVLDDVALSVAHRLWADQRVLHFSRGRTDHPGLTTDESKNILEVLDGLGIGSILFVPLGAGSECLGFLILSRASDTPPWTEMEYDAALDIGRDLGRAVANARQLEQERALVNRLRELDGYRVELVNTVAHELRNPLAVVAGNLELVEEEPLTDDVRRSVEAAIRGTRRVEDVIDALLAMARVTDPEAPFDATPVDLRRLVRDVEEEGADAADASTITITTTLPDGPVTVLGSRDELHRMLANLLSNALKYSEPGSAVGITLIRDGEDVVLSVADRGLGISEEDVHELFSEFFRSTNPEALARKGTGLGLVIVERIVRRHEGRIAIDSELGRGTTITVTLPASPQP